MRRLLIVVLFALVLAGGAVVTWKAMGQAKLVQDDLTTARALPARVGDPDGQGDPRGGDRPPARPDRSPDPASIQRAADALLPLHATLDDGLERVRATRIVRPASSSTSWATSASTMMRTRRRPWRSRTGCGSW